MSAILRALARQTSFEELQAAFQRQREQVSGTDARNALEEDIADALRIHRTLADARKREQQLAALFETAIDLSSIADLDRTLGAICRRTRTLLGTDAAWLTLNDAVRGDTYMRMTDGIVSETFRGIRLPYGAGLGGRVAERGSCEVTDDYLADPRFQHTAGVDSVVVAEGLHAIAGAPLRRGDRVIGVVMTGNRGSRTFEPGEVALLESLAAHAAIAVENARLFAESEAAATELKTHNERAHRSLALHERLMTLVNEGGGLEDVAQTVVGIVGRGLAIVDDQGWVLARAGSHIAGLRERVEGGTVGEHLTAAFAAASSVSAGSVLIVPMLARSESIGALLASAPDEGDTRALLERSAVAAALVLSTARAAAQAEQKVRGELIQDMLASTSTSISELDRRADLLGLHLHQPHAVAVASPDPTARRWAATRLSMLAAEHRGLAGIVARTLVIVLPDQDIERAGNRVARALVGPGGEPPTVAVSGPAIGAAAIRGAYDEARRSHRLSVALGRSGVARSSTDLGAFGLLLDGASRETLQTFVAETLAPIIGDAELLATLEAFIAHHGRAPRAAAMLHIHPNTMYLRIKRLEKLLGGDWREPDQLLELHLALRLHRLLTEREPA